MFLPLRDENPSNKFPIINICLLLTNVAVFLYELTLSPHAARALEITYGVVPARIPAWLAGHGTFEAALVPFVTSMFLHGGWAHILGNLLFLWIFGDNVEDVLGHSKYLIFYLLCGCAAGMTQVLLNAGSRLPMVGASGAIAGVMGAYLIKFPHSRIVTLVFVFIFITTIEVPAVLMLLYWFFIQLFSGVGTIGYSHLSQGGTAFFAHVGGFIAGMILINVMGARPKYLQRRDLNW